MGNHLSEMQRRVTTINVEKDSHRMHQHCVQQRATQMPQSAGVDRGGNLVEEAH
jgi:hypothetical protein